MRVSNVPAGSNIPYMAWLTQLQQMLVQRKAGKTGLLGLANITNKQQSSSPQQLSASQPIQQAEGPQRIDFNALSMRISALIQEESFDISLLQVEGTKYLFGPRSLEIQKYSYIQVTGKRTFNQVGTLVDGYA